MGMFIKFECSNCGEYECDCTYEQRKGTPSLSTNKISSHPLKTGDIIHKGLKDGKLIDESYVVEVTDQGDIIAILLRGGNGIAQKWEGEYHLLSAGVRKTESVIDKMKPFQEEVNLNMVKIQEQVPIKISEVLGTFYITGRGTALIIPTEGLSNKELVEKYLRKNIEYQGKAYLVRGVETMGMPDRVSPKTSLLINLEHLL